MRYTDATENQQNAVADMVNKMMNPTVPPEGMSFTKGWDVVVSYSEEQINQLLARRYESDTTRMVKVLEFSTKNEDMMTGFEYTMHYKLNFGSPKLQFDARAISGPSCSLTMPIFGGFMQPEQSGQLGKKREFPQNVYSIKIGGIPLGSVRGENIHEDMKDMPKVVPGSKHIMFDNEVAEVAHVVLNFPLAGDALSITCEATTPDAPALKQLSSTAFADQCKEFFLDRNRVNALSYSIASLNNKTPAVGDTADLVPRVFQMASFASTIPGYQMTALSLFVEVEGSASTGLRNGLQASWSGQWVDNKTYPISVGFTASIIISAKLAYKVLLSCGFQKSQWTTAESTEKNPNGVAFTAKSQNIFSDPGVKLDYSKISTLRLNGFRRSLSEWPMEFCLKQKNGRGPPMAYIKWIIEFDCGWNDGVDLVNGYWSKGSMRFTYYITDPNNKDLPREIPCSVNLNDEAFDLSFDLANVWKMDYCKTPGSDDWDEFLQIDPSDEYWGQVLYRAKNIRPDLTISSIGLGYLRTTNLLTPDQQTIDINEAVGLKVPRDFVLVGDIVHPKLNKKDFC